MKILPIASAIFMTVTLVATSVPAIAQTSSPTNYAYLHKPIRHCHQKCDRYFFNYRYHYRCERVCSWES